MRKYTLKKRSKKNIKHSKKNIKHSKKYMKKKGGM